MPKYFVGISYPPKQATEYASTVAVYSSASGKVVARLSPPQPGRYFQAVAALGNGQRFVAAATPGFPTVGNCHTWLYEFRLTASGEPTALTPLVVPELSGWAAANSLAATATASLVSYTTAGCTKTGGGSTGPYVLGLISLPTGKSWTWPNPADSSAIRTGTRTPALEAMTYGGLPSLSADGGLLSFVSGGNPVQMPAWLVRLHEPALQVRQVPTAPDTGGMLATALSPDARVTFALTIREQVGNTLELGAYDTATGRLLQRWSVATHQSFGGEMVTTDTSGGYLLVAAFPSPANSGGIQFTIIRVATGQMSTLSVAPSSAPWDVAW